MREQHKNLIQVFLSLLIMSGTPLYAKLISLPPNYIIFYRSLIAGIAIFIYVKMCRIRITLNRPRDYFIVCLLGVFLCLHWLALFHSIQISTVAVAIIATYTYPIITIFLEPLFNKEKISLTDIFLGFIVIFGVFLIIMGHNGSMNNIILGSLWGIISAFLFSLRNIISRPYVNIYSGETILLYQVCITALILTPFLFVNFRHMGNTFGNSFNIVLLGVVFTALPHALYIKGLRTLKAKTVGIIAGLQPFLAIAVAAAVLDEIPTVLVLLGGAVVIFAAVYESYRSMKQARNN